MDGSLGIVELEAAMELWMNEGMPDMVGSQKEPTPPDNQGLNKFGLCPPFVPWTQQLKDEFNAAKKAGSLGEPGAKGSGKMAKLPPNCP